MQVFSASRKNFQNEITEHFQLHLTVLQFSWEQTFNMHELTGPIQKKAAKMITKPLPGNSQTQMAYLPENPTHFHTLL